MRLTTKMLATTNSLNQQPIELETRIPLIPSRRSETGRARIVHYDPRGTAASAFNELAAEICPAISSEDSPRIVCITSEKRGQGRSFCAANLAIALANSGRRTLLVDADRAKPAQRSIFHEIDDAACTVGAAAIQPTDVEDLDLLADRHVLRAANSTAMSFATLDALNVYLSEGYELIVVDAPPINEWQGAGSRTTSDPHLLVVNVFDRAPRPEPALGFDLFGAGVRSRRLANRASRSGGTARQWIHRFRII